MLHTKSILTNLSELGLNKYEAKAYLTLITEGISTAKNLSDITSIPYGKVYEIINLLSTKGFVAILPSKPMKCKAISPQQALLAVKKKEKEKLEKLEKTVINELEPLFNKNKRFVEPENRVWLGKGRSNINKILEAAIGKATKQIYIFTSKNGMKRVGYFRDLLEEANKRNVKILIGGPIQSDNIKDIQSLDFCDIRHIDNVPCHLFSVDGDETLLVEPIPDDDDFVYGRDIAVRISASAFTKYLENSFLSNFKAAKTIEERLRELN